MEEIWKQCTRSAKLEVSNLGRIRNTKDGKIRTLYTDAKGYLRINAMKVHVLVLEAFVCPKPEGLECRHLNDVQTDNRLDNLAWGTHRENMEDMFINGKRMRSSLAGSGISKSRKEPELGKRERLKPGPAPGTGYHGEAAKLTEEEVVSIRFLAKKGYRPCELSRMFGVTPSNISKIVARKMWAVVRLETELELDLNDEPG